MATLQEFQANLVELRAATQALPQQSGGFMGWGASKVYRRNAARSLGNQLIDICDQCVTALANQDTTNYFKFRSKVAEIDALLNIQMVLNDKAQVRRLTAAARQLQSYCKSTPTIEKPGGRSTKDAWAGQKAIDLLVEQLTLSTQHLKAKQRAGRAQLIINNAGNHADPRDDGWNSSKRADIVDPLHRVPMKDREMVGFGKTQSLTPQLVGDLAICHATAAGMLNILGRKACIYQAGGKGSALRREARDLALRLLADKSHLYLLHFKCTAQMDGHSFMLCMNPSGSVTCAESWANPAGNGLFLNLQTSKKKNKQDQLTRSKALEAVRKIFSRDPETRNEGYSALSWAYDDCVRYEQRKHDEHAKGHECDDSCRAPDGEISIIVTARQLSTPKTVKNRLEVLCKIYEAIDPMAFE